MTRLLGGPRYNRGCQYDAGDVLQEVFNTFATDMPSRPRTDMQSAPNCPLAALVGVATRDLTRGPNPCNICGQHWALRHGNIERSWMLYAKTVAENGPALASLVEGLLLRHCPTVHANAEADGAIECQMEGCPGRGRSSYIEDVVDLPPVLLLQIECQARSDGSGHLQPCLYRFS